MPDTSTMSEKAVAVFAFAAYHQLGSGQPVKSVVRSDGKGHAADADAVTELVERSLATVEGNDIAFTDEGLAVLAKAIEGLSSAARAT